MVTVAQAREHARGPARAGSPGDANAARRRAALLAASAIGLTLAAAPALAGKDGVFDGVAIDNGVATGDASFAIGSSNGFGAIASGSISMALGQFTDAGNFGATAIGSTAPAGAGASRVVIGTPGGSTAVGPNSFAGQIGATAIGSTSETGAAAGAQASGVSSTALGDGAIAGGDPFVNGLSPMPAPRRSAASPRPATGPHD